MKKRQILWAIVFGSMLAIAGCGDDDGGSGGTAGTGGTAATGGSTGSGFCATLCSACNADAVAECVPACESSIGAIPGEIDIESCPSELNAWASCLGDNDCNDDLCDAELQTWAVCVVGVPF